MGQRAPGVRSSARDMHVQSLQASASGRINVNASDDGGCAEAVGKDHSLSRELCQAASGMAQESLREKANEYELGDRFGVGRTSGQVFQAQRGEQEYAVKRARIDSFAKEEPSCAESCLAAIGEVYLLERCAGHPHIVTLCDVFCPRDDLGLALVLACWGAS